MTVLHDIVGCDAADSDMQSVRSDGDRSSVDHELRVVRRRARLIAAAEQALSRAYHQTPDCRGTLPEYFTSSLTAH